MSGQIGASVAAARFEDFAVTVSRDGDTTVVALRGELDLSSAEQFRQTLVSLEGDQRVVVDCTRLGFVDSAGLSALLRARRMLVAAGGELVLRRPSDLVRRVLEITGIDTELRVVDE